MAGSSPQPLGTPGAGGLPSCIALGSAWHVPTDGAHLGCFRAWESVQRVQGQPSLFHWAPGLDSRGPLPVRLTPRHASLLLALPVPVRVPEAQPALLVCCKAAHGLGIVDLEREWRQAAKPPSAVPSAPPPSSPPSLEAGTSLAPLCGRHFPSTARPPPSCPLSRSPSCREQLASTEGMYIAQGHPWLVSAGSGVKFRQVDSRAQS